MLGSFRCLCDRWLSIDKGEVCGTCGFDAREAFNGRTVDFTDPAGAREDAGQLRDMLAAEGFGRDRSGGGL
jgi:hypothetical protein